MKNKTLRVGLDKEELMNLLNGDIYTYKFGKENVRVFKQSYSDRIKELN